MADTYSTQSPFIDKEADDKDLERQNKVDVATIGAVSRAMSGGGTLPAAAPGAQPPPTPEQMGVNAPQKPMGAFDSFNDLLQQNDPSLAAVRQKAIQGVTQQFDNPAAAFDEGAGIAREDLARSLQSARASQREDLIKTFGPNADQVMAGMGNFDQQGILQTRDLNRRLTADRAQAAQAGLSQAIAGAMGLTGQALQAFEGQQGRALAREEREDIQAFQAGENELGRAFTREERTAIQDFQKAERLGAQDFASAEAALGRTFSREEREAIQAWQTSERLSTQDFSRIMQDRGWANERELMTIRNNHEKELQATGIAADVAKQLADQAHQVRLQERDQQFTAAQSEITRKWQTGERIETQEFQKVIQANEQRGREAIANLEILAREKLAKGEWDQQSKLQAERLLFEAAEAEKGRSQQYLMFSAQMAQEDAQFAKEFGLKTEALALQKQETLAQLDLAKEQLGITKEQWEMAKSDAKFNKALDLAMIGMNMWNGEDPAALEPFVGKLAQTLGEGLGLDPAILEKAIKASVTKNATGTTAPGGTGKASDVEKAKSYLDGLDLSANVNVAGLQKGIDESMAKATGRQALGNVKYEIDRNGLTDPDQVYKLLVTLFGKDMVDTGGASVAWYVKQGKWTPETYKRLTGKDYVDPTKG